MTHQDVALPVAYVDPPRLRAITRLSVDAGARWWRDIVSLHRSNRSSDWGAAELTEAQTSYAAADVLYLHALKARLDAMLVREGRAELAAACFRFLPDRVRLDLAGFANEDIFAHS